DRTMPEYVVIATWPFGRTAVTVAAELLKQGRPALDAALAGAQAVEDDPKVHSVGYAGLPNAIGTVQLDACVMDGQTLNCGAVAEKGSLGGVCTTSGLAHKLPGRVGDSPLIGHGLYVDNTAGAAGGTGVGEEIIRIGGSLTVVEALRAGRSAQEACELAVRKVNSLAARRGVPPASVAFLALDKQGRVGAACSERTKCEYAVGRPGN